MAKKIATTAGSEAEMRDESQSLGTYLANIRQVRRMTLRAVEEATGKEVSNAYLSQLEKDKISRPSPNVLHALAAAYVVPYETLMEKAGYITPTVEIQDVLRAGKSVGKERVSALANEKLTEEEEERVLEYLAFLRSRKGGTK
jgi:HTH-type transcriptional regulator, competence development regulator